mgnify:CR=1 FL=1
MIGFLLVIVVSLLTCSGQLCQKQAAHCWERAGEARLKQTLRWLALAVLLPALLAWPIGIAAVAGARLAGASTIVAVDIDPRKLEWAREFGATHTIDSSGTPVRIASAALARRWRQVPCTGITLRGRTPL